MRRTAPKPPGPPPQKAYRKGSRPPNSSVECLTGKAMNPSSLCYNFPARAIELHS